MVLRRAGLPWSELFQLHVVKKVSELVERRWNLGLGYVDLGDKTLRPPQASSFARQRSLCQLVQDRDMGRRACEATAHATARQLEDAATGGESLPAAPAKIVCHAALTELVAPVIVDGRLAGGLLLGGFSPSGETRAGSLPPGISAADGRRAPQLDPQEISFATELLRAAAEEISSHMNTVLQRDSAPSELQSPYATRYSYDAIIGRSPAMQKLYALLDRVVQSDATVLIQGENGTGKELVARAIHNNSGRKNRRFVVTNCSAFNDNLLDSELFGHKRGAFTGAIADRQGLFEVADRGTFFLDEIGDMSPTLQVKLLRVLQEGTFTPVGDTEPRRVDVRIIAATNRDLGALVARGAFREDLFYRINVINIVIPPLRDRREDIQLLVDHFLKKHIKGGRAKAKRLNEACMRRLAEHDWEGNVRELENEVERLVVLSDDARMIDEKLLSPHIQRRDVGGAAQRSERSRSLPEAVRRLERTMIRESLKRNKWNKTRVAEELQISRRNLIRLVQKYGLEGERA